jgi:hypothetical protein
MPPTRFGFSTAAELAPTDRLRLQCGAEHLCELGQRAVAEFLREAANDADDLQRILARLDRWRGLTPEMVRAAGGDRFPSELQVVEGWATRSRRRSAAGGGQ